MEAIINRRACDADSRRGNWWEGQTRSHDITEHLKRLTLHCDGAGLAVADGDIGQWDVHTSPAGVHAPMAGTQGGKGQHSSEGGREIYCYIL